MLKTVPVIPASPLYSASTEWPTPSHSGRCGSTSSWASRCDVHQAILQWPLHVDSRRSIARDECACRAALRRPPRRLRCVNVSASRVPHPAGVSCLSSECLRAQHAALDRVVGEARRGRANSVVGIRTTIQRWAGTHEMMMAGTAAFNPALPASAIVTSDLTARNSGR